MVDIKKISVSDLENIKGGGISVIGGSLVFVAIIAFVSGIIEGITHPRRCSE